MPSDGLFPPAKRDRRSRLKRLEYILKNKEGEQTASQVAAIFMINEGICSRKLREYVRVLEVAGKIDEGDVKDIEENIKIL